MKEQKPAKQDAVFRVWESTKDLLPYSEWLPEVVGTARELIHIGSVPVQLPEEPDANATSAVPNAKEVRFIDADVSKYRKLLSIFRKRHAK